MLIKRPHMPDVTDFGASTGFLDAAPFILPL